MTGEELQAAVAKILAEEKQPMIDWSYVKTLCDDVLRRVNTEPAPVYPNKLYRFLEDYDAREKDERHERMAYPNGQRAFVEGYLAGNDG